MMRSIFLRTLYDKRFFMLGWSIGLSMMAILMVAMYPALKDSMAELAASMPENLRGLVGDTSSFSHMDSYLSTQLYDIRIPMFIMIMMTVLGLGLSVGNEEKGTLRSVLSTNRSRTRWLIETVFSVMVIAAVVITVSILVTLAGVSLIGDFISLTTLMQLAGLSWVFAMTMFFIVFGIGVASGHRSLTMGVGVGLIIATIALQAGSTVDWLDSYQWMSLLHYYDAKTLLGTGIDWWHLASQFLIILVTGTIGWSLFRRRDIY